MGMFGLLFSACVGTPDHGDFGIAAAGLSETPAPIEAGDPKAVDPWKELNTPLSWGPANDAPSYDQAAVRWLSSPGRDPAYPAMETWCDEDRSTPFYVQTFGMNRQGFVFGTIGRRGFGGDDGHPFVLSPEGEVHVGPQGLRVLQLFDLLPEEELPRVLALGSAGTRFAGRVVVRADFRELVVGPSLDISGHSNRWLFRNSRRDGQPGTVRELLTFSDDGALADSEEASFEISGCDINNRGTLWCSRYGESGRYYEITRVSDLHTLPWVRAVLSSDAFPDARMASEDDMVAVSGAWAVGGDDGFLGASRRFVGLWDLGAELTRARVCAPENRWLDCTNDTIRWAQVPEDAVPPGQGFALGRRCMGLTLSYSGNPAKVSNDPRMFCFDDSPPTLLALSGNDMPRGWDPSFRILDTVAITPNGYLFRATGPSGAQCAVRYQRAETR